MNSKMKSVRNWGRLGMKYKLEELSNTEIEVIDGDRGKNYPHQSEFQNIGFCLFLSAKNVTKTGFVFGETQYISKEKDKLLNNGKLNRGDIVITTRGTVGNVALYSDKVPYDNMRINSGMLIVRCSKSISNQYLYHALKSEWFQRQIMSVQSGSAQPQLPKSHFLKMRIPLPTLTIQQRIASVLQTFDEKIELNNRINENLQQQAQAIYTLLFIEQRNPEWQEGKLADLIAVKYGKDHKKLEDGAYPVYGSGGIMRYVEHPLYSGESVLIPRKGTLNNVMYVNGAFWSVDTMFYTEMLQPNLAKFIYHFVKGKDLASLNAGSAVPSMTTNILNAMQLYIPDDGTLQRFEQLVAPMYTAMQENEKQSSNLALVRDTLLPKLMSGELDVSDIDL